MSRLYYILDEHHNVIPATQDEWAKMFIDDPKKKRVAETTVDTPKGRMWISTVFLGLNHSYSGGLEVFETMVFPEGDWADELCWRYSTWDEAVAGHEAAVTRIQNELETP